MEPELFIRIYAFIAVLSYLMLYIEMSFMHPYRQDDRSWVLRLGVLWCVGWVLVFVFVILPILNDYYKKSAIYKLLNKDMM